MELVAAKVFLLDNTIQGYVTKIILVFHVVWKVSKLARNDPRHSNKQVYRICCEKSSEFVLKYQFNSKPVYGKVNN